MKQKLRIMAFGVACLPALLLASALDVEMPISKQAYRDVNSGQATSPSAATPTADQSTQNTNTNANPNAAQYQINNNHITYLSNKTDNMMVQIKSLNHMVTMLGQEIDRLKSTQSGDAANSELSFWQSGISWVESGGSTAYMNLGGAALLLVGLGYMAGRTRGSSRKTAKATKMAAVSAGDDEDVKDTEAEYDFMATDEAIPAQLDLARSYLAMDDTEQAKVVLEKVITRGNDAQKKEAQLVLDDIANKPSKADA